MTKQILKTQFYTVAAVAEMLGKHPVTIRMHCRNKGIGKKVGRDWVLTAADIETIRKTPRSGRPAGSKNIRTKTPIESPAAPG